VGDKIKVDFSGGPTLIQPVETDIKGDGTIHLDFVGDIQIAGKTPGEVEREIQKKYVPDYYTHLNVTVTPSVRYFYVDGQVNAESGGGGRVMYVGPITVTRAIAAAGGFNSFAARNKVRLYRVDGKIIIVNCNKALDHPELDPPVYPGDKIFVPTRLF
jgi:polysaccharide export outer membrane protein